MCDTKNQTFIGCSDACRERIAGSCDSTLTSCQPLGSSSEQRAKVKVKPHKWQSFSTPHWYS
jgi:hypothetical protein